MHAFDVSQHVWMDLSSSQNGSIRPAPRYYHGFAAVLGKIYLFGGSSYSGILVTNITNK
jgi:hypothetical protein